MAESPREEHNRRMREAREAYNAEREEAATLEAERTSARLAQADEGHGSPAGDGMPRRRTHSREIIEE